MGTDAFELETFEHVSTGGGAVLLRLSGRWGAEAPASPSLLVDDGRRSHALRALPAPAPAGRGAWQAAFAADPHVIDARSAFALRAADGDLVDLPAPRARPKPTRTASPPVAEPDGSLAEARRQAMLFLQSRLEAEQEAHAAALARAEAAETSLGETRAAIALLDNALETQLEAAAALDLEVETLEAERESETQAILRLVRQARREESGPPSPFPRWERTRRLAARWVASLGGPGERAEADAGDPAPLDASAR
ncbi:MAG: hypothetical protein QOK31_714 [Solirubrobacteraceae bacterium]|nr:hypothetical protein [Solirubrobacteraceae bacterium]